MTEQFMTLQPKPSRIKINQQTINTYIIRLHEDIGMPDEYSDEFDIINSAQPEDTIVLDICTDGGVGDTAMLFHRALRNTAAHTVAVIGPSCASAGGIIALSCAEFVLDDTSSLMVHTSTYGFGRSKDTDIYEHANFSRKQLRKLYEGVFSGFMSKEEIEDVIKGTPFYFDDEQLAERLEMLSEYRTQKVLSGMEENEEFESHKPLEQMIEESVSTAVDAAMKNVLKRFDIIEKPKPARKAVKKNADTETLGQVIGEFKDRGKKFFENLVDEAPVEA